MALVLRHQTQAQFIARVREAYRTGDAATVVKIARFLLAKVQSGDLTQTQIRNAFGLTVAQWDVLKVKMQDYVAAADIAASAAGE